MSRTSRHSFSFVSTTFEHRGRYDTSQTSFCSLYLSPKSLLVGYSSAVARTKKGGTQEFRFTAGSDSTSCCRGKQNNAYRGAHSYSTASTKEYDVREERSSPQCRRNEVDTWQKISCRMYLLVLVDSLSDLNTAWYRYKTFSCTALSMAPMIYDPGQSRRRTCSVRSHQSCREGMGLFHAARKQNRAAPEGFYNTVADDKGDWRPCAAMPPHGGRGVEVVLR